MVSFGAEGTPCGCAKRPVRSLSHPLLEALASYVRPPPGGRTPTTLGAGLARWGGVAARSTRSPPTAHPATYPPPTCPWEGQFGTIGE